MTTEAAMATRRRYTIEQTATGVVLGTYDAVDEADAWRQLCADAGTDEEPGDGIAIRATGAWALPEVD